MEKNKFVEIISNSYRIAHSHNLHFWSFLAVTGGTLMALDYLSPLAYAVGLPFANLLHTDPVTAGIQIFRILHRIFAFVWGGLLIIYGCYLFCFGKLQVLKPLKKPLKDQIAEAKALTGRYLFGKPIPKAVAEKMDRHNVFVAYLAIVLGISFFLLSVSGIGLMFRYALGLTNDQAAILLFLHDLGFGLSMLFVLFHLFAAFHPANRPILNAMMKDGKVPLEFAKEDMPQYLKRIKVEE